MCFEKMPSPIDNALNELRRPRNYINTAAGMIPVTGAINSAVNAAPMMYAGREVLQDPRNLINAGLGINPVTGLLGAATNALTPAIAAGRNYFNPSIPAGDNGDPPATPGSYTISPRMEMEQRLDELHRKVDADIARIYGNKPNQPATILSGGDAAPDGSAATGTQLSMRQPSPEEMLSFLGGAQNLAMYGRAASDLVPGMGVREADVPVSRLANEDDMEDMLYGGRSPEEISRLQRGEALDEVVIDSDYELSDAEKGQKSTEDIKKMVRERNAMRKAEKPETQTKKTVERPQVDGKTDYMVPYRNAEMMRRGAFLDADSSLQGLKNREMQQGFITAGNKKYAITDKFLKSNDPADLGPELSGEDTAKLKAQELLNDNIKNVSAPSATTQNPMLGAGEGFDATDGKTTKYMDMSTANFVENMATPAEMEDSFSPLDYDADLWRDQRFLKGDHQHGIISNF